MWSNSWITGMMLNDVNQDQFIFFLWESESLTYRHFFPKMKRILHLVKKKKLTECLIEILHIGQSDTYQAYYSHRAISLLHNTKKTSYQYAHISYSSVIDHIFLCKSICLVPISPTVPLWAFLSRSLSTCFNYLWLDTRQQKVFLTP